MSDIYGLLESEGIDIEDIGNDEYEAVAGYTVNEDYKDDKVVSIINRKISDISNQISVDGERNSQYICFSMDRYIDGIDISTKEIRIHYETPNGDYGENMPINVMRNSQNVIFGWVVPASALIVAGDIKFIVYAVGEDYTYKTLTLAYKVEQTLDIGGGLPEPDMAWYEDVMQRLATNNQIVGTFQSRLDTLEAENAKLKAYRDRKWELIERVDITEDTTADITCNFDFEAEAVGFRVYAPAIPSLGSSSRYIILSALFGGHWKHLGILTNGQMKDYDVFSVAGFQRKWGGIEQIFNGYRLGTETETMVLATTGVLPAQCFMPSISQYNLPITGLKLTKYSTSEFTLPAGSYAQFYAVRTT